MSYKDHIEKVDGKKTKEILLFSLSTCMWCHKAIDLLNELGIQYDHVVVDLLDKEDDQNEVYKEIEKFSKDAGFPVLIIGGKKAIIGFKEAEIRDLAK